jgi:hypothetical protein
MQEQHVVVQLPLQYVHRRNTTYRAIQTFKNHLVACLYSTAPDFPMNLWDGLIPRALQTLNLLSTSMVQPQMSAYVYVQGSFDYNRTPLGPP